MQSLLRKIPLKHIQNISIRNKSGKSKKKQKEKPKNYIIVRPTHQDYEETLDLMHTAYFNEEPTTASIGYKSCSVYDDKIIRSLCEGYSLVAKCKHNGDILGAAINETSNCWDPQLTEKLACNLKCDKIKKLLLFYAHLQRAPDLWWKYGTNKIFELGHLVTRKDQRRKGLARRLAEESRQVAADCAFTLFRVDATSFYSAKLCEAMKLKMVHEIPYCSYVGEDQQPVFKTKDPHKSVKVYIDDNPQKNAEKFVLR